MKLSMKIEDFSWWELILLLTYLITPLEYASLRRGPDADPLQRHQQAWKSHRPPLLPHWASIEIFVSDPSRANRLYGAIAAGSYLR